MAVGLHPEYSSPGRTTLSLPGGFIFPATDTTGNEWCRTGFHPPGVRNVVSTPGRVCTGTGAGHKEGKSVTVKTIFYSYSGVTRGIAEKIQSECGGETVEVKTVKPYSTITAYSMGCYRAMRGESDEIRPSSIDVSTFDCIVIGTPVWMFRAAPAVNAAVAAMTGCEGKAAILFATCGAQAKETLPLLAEALKAKGVKVAGEFVFDKNDVKNKQKVDALIAAVKSAGGAEIKITL